MSIKKNDDGSIEVSGKDLVRFKKVIDEFEVKELADLAARRAVAEKNRASGMSVRQSRKDAQSAKATREMRSVIRARLARGENSQQAIRAAIKVGKWS